MIPGRRFQWALDEPISSVPMLRYPLSPRFCPPCHSFTPFLHFFLLFFLLHIFLFSSCFTLLFTYLSVNLSSCVSPVRFLSSSFYWPKFSISSFSSLPSFFFVLLVSVPKSNSRSICDLEGFRAEAGHYGPLSLLGHGNTENRGPILSAKKFIARSTLIGREIIGHSFSPSARSKRLSLIHDFSRIIAGSRHLLYPFSFSPFVSLSKPFSSSSFWIFSNEQTSF